MPPMLPKTSGRNVVKFYSFWRSLASFRVRVALNLKGIVPDEVISVDLIKGEQRRAPYKAVNPQMLLPALVDGDGPILFQSVAIMEYLDETHWTPPLLPPTPRARARVRALAAIVASDSHPLMVPRVRNFLEQDLRLDEPTRNNGSATGSPKGSPRWKGISRATTRPASIATATRSPLPTSVLPDRRSARASSRWILRPIRRCSASPRHASPSTPSLAPIR